MPYTSSDSLYPSKFFLSDTPGCIMMHDSKGKLQGYMTEISPNSNHTLITAIKLFPQKDKIDFYTALQTNSWNPSPENIPYFLKICTNLFLNMQVEHEKGNFFRGIRPETCYFNFKNKCTYEIQIPFLESETPGFYTQNDLHEMNQNSDFQNSELWLKIRQKKDIFAIATTIWYMISSSLPFPIKHDYPDMEYIYGSDNITSRAGSKIKEILMQAFNKNPLYRPNFRELARIFHNEC